MTATSPDLLERIRQQFNNAPYPRIPLERSPKENYASLYVHNLVTPYYLRDQKVVSTEGKLILDVGCGSGYTSLTLAEANPGAKVFGIDISEASIDLARKRLSHYSFNNAEFHVLGVEELSELNISFDYINCDEVLYLLIDPVAGLQAMRDVLKPDGIIRANFHSSLQRRVYLQVQKFSEMIGLMDLDSQEQELSMLREIMRNLKPEVFAKRAGWAPHFETNDQSVLSNHLLRGDKGWSILEFFDALDQTSLEFISMVNWPSWDLLTLFSDITELPIEVGLKLASASPREQLHMYELLNPITHRLLDLWCGAADGGLTSKPVDSWSQAVWRSAKACFHPQLLTDSFKTALIEAVTQNNPFDFDIHLSGYGGNTRVDSLFVASLLPMLEGAQTVETLLQRWLQLRPINPLTLAPSCEDEAFCSVQTQLQQLQELGYILLEL